MQQGKGFWSRLQRVLFILIIGWLVFSAALVLLFRWLDPPTTAFIIADGIAAHRDNHYRHPHPWVDWNRISPQMKLAVVAAEDQRFPQHWGFDFRSIDDSLRAHERGHRLRGASTISQQTAKNLFLWSSQSWMRKGLEAYFVLLIEALWSKQRILEMYLNIAEFGNGIFGVGAASEAFFGKPAARLNPDESALLAAVLPNPKRLHVAAPSNYVQARVHWITGQMAQLGGTAYVANL